jgi:hypothetical protein
MRTAGRRVRGRREGQAGGRGDGVSLDQAHADPAHGDPARGDPAHGDPAHGVPAHAPPAPTPPGIRTRAGSAGQEPMATG